MGREELIKRLMPTFVIELVTYIDDFNRELLALEKADKIVASDEMVLLLQRTAHSLKGASRSVALPNIEACCHKMEDLVSLCLKKNAFSPGIFQTLFLCVDSFRMAADRLTREHERPEEAVVETNYLLDSVIVAVSCDSPLPQLPNAKIAVSAQTLKDENRAHENSERIPTPEVGRTVTQHVHVQADQLDRLMTDATELLVECGQFDRKLETLEEIRSHLAEEANQVARLKRRLKAQIKSLTEHEYEMLALDKIKIDKVMRELDQLIAGITKGSRNNSQTAKAINSGVQTLRLVPFESTCQSFERSIRDLALATGKKIDFEIHGGDVGIDRSIAEELKAPLLHLLRNAVDHGIESAEIREKQHKPKRAKIILSAAVEGAILTVSLADDGGGIDEIAVQSRAQAQGLSEATADGLKVGDSNLDLIFLPGFSTAKMITEISGRGLGLDVVKSTIERVGGQIELKSTAGLGTTFTLRVPTTLTTTRALLVQELGQTYAVLLSNVVKVLRLSAQDFTIVDGQDAVKIDSNIVRVISLRTIFGAEPIAPAEDTKVSALLLTADKTTIVLIVDKLLSEREIVIKALSDRLKSMRLFIGTTVIDDGSVALILNSPELIRSASSAAAIRRNKTDSKNKKRILVADDSITTRSMEKNILEAAGYEVITSNDGAQAWRLLQEKGADLVVSDVEMPNMDGFTLASTVRASRDFVDIPFILVTALAKDSDKARGIEVGANAYLVKSEFEQDNLLEVIRQLL